MKPAFGGTRYIIAGLELAGYTVLKVPDRACLILERGTVRFSMALAGLTLGGALQHADALFLKASRERLDAAATAPQPAQEPA